MQLPSLNGIINQVTKVRMPDGEEVALVDWTWQPLYSSVILLDGMTDLDVGAFTYSLGETVSVSQNVTSGDEPVATERHTNVSEGAELDATEEMLVYAIQVEVLQLAYSSGSGSSSFSPGGLNSSGLPRAPLIGRLQYQIQVALEISQKDYHKAGLGWFAAGFGVSGFGENGGTAGTHVANGVASREAVDQFPVPTHIGGTEKYAVKFLNSGGSALDFVGDDGAADNTAAAFCRAYLTGLRKRPTG